MPGFSITPSYRRKSVGETCGTARCWIIGAQKDGFSRENLERTFPGASVYTYRENFLERIVPTGKAGQALEFILNGLEAGPAVIRQAVEEHVTLSKGNYRRLVTMDDRFTHALDAAGVEEFDHRSPPRIGSRGRTFTGKPIKAYRFKNARQEAA